MNWPGLIEHFKQYLPVTEKTPMLTLHEGNTPLIHLKNLSEKLGINLHVKYEGANPTGSFKDRGMVMAVAKAVEEGSKIVICASTGNTSASAAAYATRAGIRAIIVIPKGKVALGKLAQAMMYGAEIIEIDGNFDDALKTVQKMNETLPVTLVNSINPYRIEGQKTAAFEVCEQLGKAPDVLAVPIGNAGNITAYWNGFKEYHEQNQTGLPTMLGFEAEGAAAITKDEVVEAPETVATAIRIGNPASWERALKVREESNGLIDSVNDEEILEAFTLIAKTEGIFAEPGSCASIAGVIKHCQKGTIKKGQTVVTVLTGNGLKDSETAMNQQQIKPVSLPNDENEIYKFIKNSVQEQ